MKKVFIFDFDGTFYSGEHKFDRVGEDIINNRRRFLSRLSDDEYEMICKENPKWMSAITGNDIVRCMIKLMKKYKNLDIDIEDFYKWQNDFIYDIVIDYDKVVEFKFMEELTSNYPVYVVSNSSLKHILYYMKKLNINPQWFRKVIANEFNRDDPSKQYYYRKIMEIENIEAHDIYVIGDSVESDLNPALHLGMKAFYVSDANEIKNIVSSILDNEI